jgi:hypothetical protein
MLFKHVVPCHEANEDHDAVVHYDYDEVHYYEDYDRFGRRGKQLAKLEKVSEPTAGSEPGGGFLRFDPPPESFQRRRSIHHVPGASGTIRR